MSFPLELEVLPQLAELGSFEAQTYSKAAGNFSEVFSWGGKRSSQELVGSEGLSWSSGMMNTPCLVFFEVHWGF